MTQAEEQRLDAYQEHTANLSRLQQHVQAYERLYERMSDHINWAELPEGCVHQDLTRFMGRLKSRISGMAATEARMERENAELLATLCPEALEYV